MSRTPPGPAPEGTSGGPAHDTWVAVCDHPLALADISSWVVRPQCGASVVFTGTVRDHAEGRTGVSALEYEAYGEQVEPRLTVIADDARRRWSDLGRIALVHRTGRLGVEEASVVVAVSAPHRAEAFEAARFCIDTLKATAPIWKKETWDGGEDWSPCATELPAAPSRSEGMPR
jgi:molybdopterin synthase catalytic subunit